MELTSNKKLRVLLLPFFATSHIGPFTDFAIRLATAKPGAVEPTVAVTPANVPVVAAALERHGLTAKEGLVNIVTNPFPVVDGFPPGVENLSAAGSADQASRIDAAAVDEALTRPAQEALVRELSPDAVVTDVHFFWNGAVAAGLEAPCPCVMFSVIGPFSTLAMRRLAVRDDDCPGSDEESRSPAAELAVHGLPGPEIRIPATELPEFLRSQKLRDCLNPSWAAMDRCFGVAFNLFADLEQQYCETYARNVSARAYFVGPVSLPLPPAGDQLLPPCVRWLDSKPSCSVVYVCFGTYAAVSEDQLWELALGLEASGKPFLWVVRGWSTPPAGWEERVEDRGMLVRGWAPQTTILAHRAVGAFLTHCGSSSLLEAAVAGVPMLTWPLVFDQFIQERLVTDVIESVNH
ncbi:hypothetical protein EJB05_42681, partial [Eragrostis curvula]